VILRPAGRFVDKSVVLFRRNGPVRAIAASRVFDKLTAKGQVTSRSC
jgi:hypothetical protein